jgi:hypothetical protein
VGLCVCQATIFTSPHLNNPLTPPVSLTMSSIPLCHSKRGHASEAGAWPVVFKEFTVRGVRGKSKILPAALEPIVEGNTSTVVHRASKICGITPPQGKHPGVCTSPVLLDAVPASTNASTAQEKNAGFTLWKGGRSIYQAYYCSEESDDDMSVDDASDSEYFSTSGDNNNEEDEELFININDEEDNNFFVDINLPLEDKHHSSFPKNSKSPWNVLVGGPQKTDTTGMTEEKAKETQEKD